MHSTQILSSSFLFLHDTPTTEIYTLSLHDALPISPHLDSRPDPGSRAGGGRTDRLDVRLRLTLRLVRIRDRKSTRLNSSHGSISYAVFCLKKKRERYPRETRTVPATATRPGAAASS